MDRPKGCTNVDFPAWSMPENKNLAPGMPSTFIPVPIAIFCCKKDCGMEAFRLSVCKAITGHRSQRMTIAVDEPFEKRVLCYPET